MQGLIQIDQFPVAPMLADEVLSGESSGKDRIRILAEKTNAGKIVHGDYYLQGEKIQFHLWVQDMIANKNIVPLEPTSGPIEDPDAAFEPLRLKLLGGLAVVFDPLLNDFFSIAKEPPNFKAYKELLVGIKAFIQQDWHRAIKSLLLAAEYDPSLKLALGFAAVGYLNLYDDDKVKELTEEMERSRPDLSTKERHFLDWLQAHLNRDLEAKLQATRAISSPTQIFNWQHGKNAIDNNYPREAVDALKKFNPYDDSLEGWIERYWLLLTRAYHMLGDFEQELKEARRGRRQKPERSSGIWGEVIACAALGRIKDLKRLFEESKAFLPPQTGAMMLTAGRELRAHGFRAESIQILNDTLSWFGNRPDEEKASTEFRFSMARTLYFLERWDEAFTIFEGLNREDPSYIPYRGYVGVTAASKGDRENALRISKELEENLGPGSPTYWRARIAAVLGDKENAVNLLRQAFKEGVAYPYHPVEEFEPLGDYPPFVQFMKPKG
jgi:tetratricopeptide (TPR) repeat protein